MARTSQTQRNYAIEEAKTLIIVAVAAVQIADRKQRLEDEKKFKPTFGQLQTALRDGKITLPAGTDLTLPAHSNFTSVNDPIEHWIQANSVKCVPETNVSYYNSVKGFCSTTSNWDEVATGRHYTSSSDTYYYKQVNLDKVKKLIAAFDYTKRTIMLGDAAEMSVALTELNERISSI